MFMSKLKRRWNYSKSIIGFVLIVLGGIALWNIIQEGSFTLLSKLGVHNFYAQNGIIVGLSILILITGGFGVFDGIKKLIKG